MAHRLTAEEISNASIFLAFATETEYTRVYMDVFTRARICIGLLREEYRRVLARVYTCHKLASSLISTASLLFCFLSLTRQEEGL